MTAEDMAQREFLCDRVMLVWQASGLSKTKFAASIGISVARLGNYAAYFRTPSHAILSRICDTYGIPPAYFFTATSRAANTPVVRRAMELAEEKKASKAA